MILIVVCGLKTTVKPPGPKRTATSKAMEDRVIALVEQNKTGREKSAETLGFQIG